MFTAMGLMFIGIVFGRVFRRGPLPVLLGRALLPAILLLLFLMGVAIGGDAGLMAGLSLLGGRSVTLTLFCLAGALVCVRAAGPWLAPVLPAPAAETTRPAKVEAGSAARRRLAQMLPSLLLFAFFLAGMGAGAWTSLPAWFRDGRLSEWALWLMISLAGFSVGSDRRLRELLGLLRPRFLLLPLANTAGTLAGAAASSLFLAYSATDCMAVGSGFAYYSLSSIFITQYRGAELGTMALLCNLLRELATMLAAPIIVRLGGGPGLIACGGASTMDSTLPVVMSCLGREWIFPSIASGIIMDFSVPFWVLFFCNL